MNPLENMQHHLEYHYNINSSTMLFIAKERLINFRKYLFLRSNAILIY